MEDMGRVHEGQAWRNHSRPNSCSDHLEPAKDDRSVARILELFDWYVTLRLAVVIGHFDRQVGTDNTGEKWRCALVDFSYCNVCFNMKQLVEVLHGDLQVTIHQILMEAQENILEVIKTLLTAYTSKSHSCRLPR